MHQSDTYTTQATNDKDEAAPVGAAGKAETDMVEGDMSEVAGAGDDVTASMAEGCWDQQCNSYRHRQCHHGGHDQEQYGQGGRG